MRQFGHKRPVRDGKGDIVEMEDSPVRAVTREALGGAFLADKDRKLIVSLEAGDLVCVRPSQTRRVYRVTAKDLFHWLLRNEANRLTLEKARDRKARRDAFLARQRQRRAERRLFSQKETKPRMNTKGHESEGVKVDCR